MSTIWVLSQAEEWTDKVCKGYGSPEAALLGEGLVKAKLDRKEKKETKEGRKVMSEPSLPPLPSFMCQ